MSVKDNIITELNSHASQDKKQGLERFFKIGKGDYGEGDIFIGVIVPDQRSIAKKYYREITLPELVLLLREPVHEYRLTALYILTLRYEKVKAERDEIVTIYLSNTKYINNWDLVDVSAPKILGPYLLTGGDRGVLYDLACSADLWEQRIAIMSTLAFIRAGEYDDTFRISEILLTHQHDLIHKAVGWMLREVGNRDLEAELIFLRKHYRKMPRTMLRYAIEKFDRGLRERFMKGEE